MINLSTAVLQCVFSTHNHFCIWGELSINLLVLFSRMTAHSVANCIAHLHHLLTNTAATVTQTTGICTYRWIYLFVFLLLLNMCIIWQVHFGRIVNVSDLNFDNKLWRGILPCPATWMFIFYFIKCVKKCYWIQKKGFQRRSSRGKKYSLVLRHKRALFHSSFFEPFQYLLCESDYLFLLKKQMVLISIYTKQIIE